MTTYDDIDKSVRSGAPIEVYKFEGELGEYLYTDCNEEVTVDGVLYKPLPGLSRTAIEVSSILDSVQTNDISMPITSALAQLYHFLRMPLSLNVEIRSVHRGTDFATDWKLEFQGEITSFPVKDNVATCRVQSIIQGGLNLQLNQITFQTQCNNEFCDEHCTLLEATFTTTSTVTDIKDNVITVVDDHNLDHKLKVGKLRNQRTGETRAIIDNVTNVVTVGYGFIDLVVGDTVDLVRGCDNTYTTCSVEYNNLLNNTSFMFLPSTNPYVDPV
jgi:uncharacterized phage protein (TIGR02218 family)